MKIFRSELCTTEFRLFMTKIDTIAHWMQLKKTQLFFWDYNQLKERQTIVMYEISALNNIP